MRLLRLFSVGSSIAALLVVAPATQVEASTGALLAWGYNFGGQLGRPDLAEGAAAGVGQITQPPNLVHVTGGFRYSVGLTADGDVVTAGDNADLALGDPAVTSRTTFGPVPGVPPASQVFAGMHAAAALESDGSLWVWGTQVSDGVDATPGGPSAVRVEGLPPATAVAIGFTHWVALDVNGDVWVWGLNDYGQLGLGDDLTRTTPTKLAGVGAVEAIAAGANSTYVVRTDGSVLAWGDGRDGQLGRQVDQSADPLPVALPVAARSVSSRGYHVCVTVADTWSTAWCWGRNDEHQTGNFEARDYVPAPVRSAAGAAPLQSVLAVSVGGWHTLLMTADGLVWGFGERVASGHSTASVNVRPVAGVSDIGSLAAGWATSFAYADPDVEAPTAKIDPPASPLLIQGFEGGPRDRLTGVATDDRALLYVIVKFVDRQGLRGTQQSLAETTCTDQRRSCTWSIGLPSGGNYRARAYPRDYQDNIGESRPVEFTVL